MKSVSCLFLGAHHAALIFHTLMKNAYSSGKTAILWLTGEYFPCNITTRVAVTNAAPFSLPEVEGQQCLCSRVFNEECPCWVTKGLNNSREVGWESPSSPEAKGKFPTALGMFCIPHRVLALHKSPPHKQTNKQPTKILIMLFPGVRKPLPLPRNESLFSKSY